MTHIRTALVCLALLPVAFAYAQDYPAKPITFVIGYAAGGGTDVPTRYFAEKLSAIAGRPVLVENRPGGFTNIAAEAVARARPDGHTVLIAAGNATMASNPHLFRKLSFNPFKDFAPVTTLYQITFVVAVSAKSPARSIKELTTLLREKGDRANYAYAGSFGLVAAELYKGMAGLKAAGVSYKASPQAMQELLGGQVDFYITDSSLVLQQAKAGNVRALAVTVSRRSGLMPDVPTMDESGFKGYDLSGWFGAWLPAGTSASIVDKLAGWLNQIVATEETRKFLANVALEPLPGSSQLLREKTAQEYDKWAKLLKDAKVEPQ